MAQDSKIGEKDERFGKLVVIAYVHKRSRNTGKMEWYARAQCDCGNTKDIREDVLRRSQVVSCGCHRRKLASERNTTHGATGTPLYNTWSNMHERCRYKYDYWGRGIKVCKEWSEFLSFKKYIERNLGEKPKGYSLDRIDNDRGYEPGNIQWAPAKFQQRNTRHNTFLTVDDKTYCIAEWAERTGISSAVICARRARGWSDEEAIGKLERSHQRMLTIGAETKPLQEWAKESGISPQLVTDRLHRGWTDEDSVFKPVEQSITVIEGFTIKEWAKKSNLPELLIYQRLNRGWEAKRAVTEQPYWRGQKK